VAIFRASSGGVTARFARDQANVIRDLVSEVAELVAGPEKAAGEASGGTPAPAAGAGPPRGAPAGPAGPGDTGVPGADELDAMVGFSANTELPDDPALARLLPDGYSDDPESASDFRRFTEESLRSAKIAAAQTVLATLPASGGRVRLSADEAEQWLKALNDVRLALGVRLGVTDNLDAVADQVEPDDPRFAAFWVLAWLGELQLSLVTALS
jgi:hypothetical protein